MRIVCPNCGRMTRDDDPLLAGRRACARCCTPLEDVTPPDGSGFAELIRTARLNLGRIPVHCACGLTLQAPMRMAGRKGRCPQCGAALRIPGNDEDLPFSTAPEAEDLGVSEASDPAAAPVIAPSGTATAAAVRPAGPRRGVAVEADDAEVDVELESQEQDGLPAWRQWLSTPRLLVLAVAIAALILAMLPMILMAFDRRRPAPPPALDSEPALVEPAGGRHQEPPPPRP